MKTAIEIIRLSLILTAICSRKTPKVDKYSFDGFNSLGELIKPQKQSFLSQPVRFSVYNGGYNHENFTRWMKLIHLKARKVQIDRELYISPETANTVNWSNEPL